MIKDNKQRKIIFKTYLGIHYNYSATAVVDQSVSFFPPGVREWLGSIMYMYSELQNVEIEPNAYLTLKNRMVRTHVLYIK